MTSFSLERGHQLANRCNLFSGTCRLQTSSAYRYPDVASQLIPSHRPDGKSSATCSSSSFCQVTCSYRFSPKSLLAKCLNTHFVIITQLTHYKKTLTNDHKIVSLILQRPEMTSKMTSYFKEY